MVEPVMLFLVFAQGDHWLEHLMVHQLVPQIEDDVRFLVLFVSVAMKTNAGSGGEFGGDAVGIEVDLVVTSLDDFALVAELGSVVAMVRAFGNRHHRKSRNLPTVNVAEAFNLRRRNSDSPSPKWNPFWCRD